MDISTLFSLIIWTFVVIIAVWALLSCVRIVKHQTVMIVESFGIYHATLKPGLHLLIPIMHSVRAIMDLRIQEIKASVDIKTSDNAFVKLPIALQISVNPDNAEDAFYKLDNPAPQITSWILNSVRSTTSNMALQELYSDKENLITEVRSLLVDKLRSFGYSIEGILVDQPQIDPQMEHSFNRIITAKREAEAAQEEAKATMTREVAKANAEAESQRVRAQGMADSREILATGLAQSIAKLQPHNIDPELSVRTLLELSRLDTIKDAATHGNSMIFDMNSIPAPNVLPIVAAEKHKE